MQAVRVLDAKVLDVADGAGQRARSRAPGGVVGHGHASFAINHNADNALITLRYTLKDADIQIAEEPFESGGQKFSRGSFVITQGVAQADLDRADERARAAARTRSPPRRR